MNRFAELYARLDETRATLEKVAAMREYFAQAPDADAAWALWLLLGNRFKRLVAPSKLPAWIAQATGWPPALVDESHAHVGDLAETLALMLDTAGLLPEATPIGLGLADWVARLQSLAGADEDAQRAAVLGWWRELPRAECFLFNKLLTGELRVGVSAGLAARAIAAHAGIDATLMQ
ncbi:MAG TPA: ATP-dependent DNA ligase, partial [Solimonas sp.]|nr:ATP-dependent DNA ligase [Solimonas sp.]